MKEKQVIDNLQLLQSVQPDRHTLLLIQKRVCSQIFPEKHFTFRKWLTVTPIIPLVAVTAVVLVLLVVMGFFPRVYEKAFVTARIALAPNQYEKAKIAFAYADQQFFSLKKNSFSSSDVKSFFGSLALANSEMAGLKLTGEKGKYTKEQCLILYSEYHSSLEAMKKEVALMDNSSQKKTLLLTEIKNYDEQSERKLHKYKE